MQHEWDGTAQNFFETRPLISVIIHADDPLYIRYALASLIQQTYEQFEVILVWFGNEKIPDLKEFNILDINVVDGRASRSFNLNQGILHANGEYIAILDQDDILYPDHFATLLAEIHGQAKVDVVYSGCKVVTCTKTDERIERNKVIEIINKPWQAGRLYYINHLTVVKREALNNLGGLRNFNGAQDWDLLLQFVELPDEQVCHIAKPLYDWRATEGSVAYQSSEKTWLFETAQSVLKNHLIERGLTGVDVIPNTNASGFVCNWNFPLDPIDIIIPTHNNVNGLKTCLNELLHNTDYPEFNIILVANRCSKDMDEYLNTLKSHPQIKILTNNDKFNWSALNNQAVAASDSSILLFLNDDVEIKQSNWLHNLCKYLYLKDIGAVGATLFYANGELQHNGIETNPKWIASNISEWGNKNVLGITRNVSAVTGACLLTKRSVWQQVGGFDEKFAVSYNDVDFCLAIRAEKLRIIQANEVELIHHEHVSYGEFDTPDKKELWHKESKLMQEKWRDQLIESYMARYDVQAQRTRMLHVEE